MANRRMFSKDVVEDDDFYMLSTTAQLLYFHLVMNSDDDGFTKSARNLMRLLEINEDAFNELVENGYLFDFQSGICCIIHWRLMNKLSGNRYHPTIYEDERTQIGYSAGNNEIYRLKQDIPTDCDLPSFTEYNSYDAESGLDKKKRARIAEFDC